MLFVVEEVPYAGDILDSRHYYIMTIPILMKIKNLD